MAIAYAHERLVPLRQALGFLNAPQSLETLRTWADEGVVSKLTGRRAVLETLQIGGQRCTNEAALYRFIASLNGLPTGELPKAIASREKDGRLANSAGDRIPWTILERAAKILEEHRQVEVAVVLRDAAIYLKANQENGE